MKMRIQFFKPVIYLVLAILLVGLSVGSAEAKNGKKNHKHVKHQGIDRNNDGVITRGEWSGNDRSFYNLDWNGDDKLSGNEIRSGTRERVNQLDSFGQLDYDENGFVSRDEWDNTSRSFDQLDRNRDQKISRNEFYNKQSYPVSVFRELDTNNTGTISRMEWRSTNDAFNRLDTNGDNRISEREFNSRQSGNVVEQIFLDIFRIR